MKNILNYSRTKNGKLAIILTAILLFAAIVFESSGIRTEIFPGEEKILKELKELKHAQLNLQKDLNEVEAIKYKRSSFIVHGRDYWMPSRDGRTETEVQKIISQAAKISGLKLSAMGDIKSVKITDEIFAMEISVTALDGMENIVRFLAELYRANPQFYWQRCQIRPDNAKDSRNVSLNGNIKFICINDQKTCDFILGNKK